jgi:hypothetical protein
MNPIFDEPQSPTYATKFTSSPGSASCSSPSSELRALDLEPCSTLQANAQTHRTPKASIARSSTRGATITTWTEVSHSGRHIAQPFSVYTSSVTAVQHKARSRRPEPQCTAAPYLFEHGGRRSGFLPFNDAHLDDRKHPILARRPLRVIVCAHQGRGPRVRANINQSVQNGTCRRSAPRGPAPQHAPRTTARTARAPRLRTARRQPDTAANTKAQRRCFVR